jgi:hypothetical protein
MKESRFCNSVNSALNFGHNVKSVSQPGATHLIYTNGDYFLAAGVDLCRQDLEIFGSSVAQRAQQLYFGKASGPKFIKEGATFFGSGNSGEPVCLARLYLRRKRFAQNNLGRIDGSTWPNNASQFVKNSIPRRV